MIDNARQATNINNRETRPGIFVGTLWPGPTVRSRARARFQELSQLGVLRSEPQIA